MGNVNLGQHEIMLEVFSMSLFIKMEMPFCLCGFDHLSAVKPSQTPQ